MSTPITPPVFNLTASFAKFASDDALQAEMAKTGGKYFDTVGNFDLVISAAAFHPNKDTGAITCKGDETWVNVRLTLASADGKAIDHWLQVPTAEIFFGPKKTYSLYTKLTKFFAGLGESATTDTAEKLIVKYFTDPAKLVGQKVNVDLGYEGDYVAPGGGGYVVMARGKPLQEDGRDTVLPDRSSAIQYAKALGIEPGFLRVLKFTARKPAKVTKPSDW